MHRPFVPRIHAKSTETQRNAVQKQESTREVFYSRSHDAVIRVYDEAGNVIETHEHAGEFKEW